MIQAVAVSGGQSLAPQPLSTKGAARAPGPSCTQNLEYDHFECKQSRICQTLSSQPHRLRCEAISLVAGLFGTNSLEVEQAACYSWEITSQDSEGSSPDFSPNSPGP